MERVLEKYIDISLDGKSIKYVLKNCYNMSTRLLNKLKFNNLITVNDAVLNINQCVSKGDILRITMPEEFPQNIVSTFIDLDIIYEDDDILIINKPAGIPVHPSQGNYENTIANGVMYYWREKGYSALFRPVNRLDKDTSGLIIVAKNQYAHHQLSEQIISGQLDRQYIAIVVGKMQEKGGIIEKPIARKEESIIEREVSKEGQYACTYYKVLAYSNDLTVVKLKLKTGRTHQIRVHMKYIGYPLLGDKLYGDEAGQSFQRQALHSFYLQFFHPVNKNNMSFNVALPNDMQSVLQNDFNFNSKEFL